MPSFRVMLCMAPHSDGTYLIANGALHGFAGFGLGSGPNLNALLYNPPYLLDGKPRPTFTLANKDWQWNQKNIPFTLGTPASNGAITVTLLGSVSSTHGNSMGAHTIMPKVTCTETSCTVDAPPTMDICPPG